MPKKVTPEVDTVDVPTDYKDLAADLTAKVNKLEQTVKVYEEHYSKLVGHCQNLEKLVSMYDSCITGIVSFIKLLDQQLKEKKENE